MSLRLDRTAFRRGGRLVVDDVSLEVAPGQLTALLGPNGAGKSTILGLLSGSFVPGRGRATLDGTAIARMPANRLARRRTVMVQSGQLNFPFAVHEVVRLGRLPFGAAGAEEDRLVARALDLVDALGLSGRLYTELSGGERQRVQLARAVAQAAGDPGDPAPHYLLLDEPTSNLDLAHQKLAMRVARQMTEDGLGVLAVLHDLNLAASFADRVVLLKSGRVAVDGTPWEATEPDSVRAVFDVSMERTRCPVSGRPSMTPIFHDRTGAHAQAAE